MTAQLRRILYVAGGLIGDDGLDVASLCKLSTGAYGGVLGSDQNRGPSIPVNTTCSSLLYATHYACKAIRHGTCDLASDGDVNIMHLPADSKAKASSFLTNASVEEKPGWWL